MPPPKRPTKRTIAEIKSDLSDPSTTRLESIELSLELNKLLEESGRTVEEYRAEKAKEIMGFLSVPLWRAECAVLALFSLFCFIVCVISLGIDKLIG